MKRMMVLPPMLKLLPTLILQQACWRTCTALAAVIAALCAAPAAWAVSPSVIGSNGYFYLNGSATKTIMKGVEEERSTLSNTQCDSLAHRLQNSGVNLIVVYYDPSRNYRQNDYFYQCMQDHGIWIAQHFGTLKKETTGSFDNVGGVLGVTPDEAWLQSRMVDLQSVITQCAHHSNILFWWLGGEFVHPNPLVTYDQNIIRSHIQRYRDRLTTLDIQFGTRRPFTVSHHFLEFGSLPVARFFNYGNDANGVPLTDLAWFTAASHFHNGDIGLPGPTWGAIIPEVTEDIWLNPYLNSAVSANGNKPIFMGGWYGDAHTLKICEASNQYDRMMEKWEHLYNVKYNGYSVYHVDEWAGNAMPHALYKWNGAKCDMTEAGLALKDINTKRIVFTSPSVQTELIAGKTYVAKVVDNFWQTATTTLNKVEFTLGSTLIGTITSAPWTLTFTAPSSKSVATTLTAKAYDNAGATYETSIPVGKLSQSYYNQLNVGSTTASVYDPYNAHGLTFKLEQISTHIVNGVSVRCGTILVRDVNTGGTWYETIDIKQIKRVNSGLSSKLFMYAADIYDNGVDRFVKLMVGPYQYPSLDILYPAPGQSTGICVVRVATNYAGKNIPWQGTSGGEPTSAEYLKTLSFNGSAGQTAETYTWNPGGSAGSRTMTVTMRDSLGATVSKSVTVNYDPGIPCYAFYGQFGDYYKSLNIWGFPSGGEPWAGIELCYRPPDGTTCDGGTWARSMLSSPTLSSEIDYYARKIAYYVTMYSTPPGTQVYVVNRCKYLDSSFTSSFGYGTITYRQLFDAVAASYMGKDSQGKYRVWASTSTETRSPLDAIEPILPTVGFWKFDESTGTVASDVSGNGNTGTLLNGPTWAAGMVGNGLSFDGADDCVTVGNPASFDVFSSGASSKLFTFAAWIKFNTVPTGTAWATLFSAYSSLYPAVFRYINGQFVLWIYSGGWRTPVTATFTPQAGRWYHLAYVKYSQTGWNIYINGVNYAVGTNPYTSSVPEKMYLGAYAPGSGGFNGMMDEVRIYNGALSAAEVQALYNVNGMAAYWKFDENIFFVTPDATGNGNHGELFNFTGTYWVPGKIGNALSFNGSTQYVGTGKSLLSNRSAFTLSGWIKPNAGGSRIGFIGQNDVIEFGFNGGSNVQGWTNGGGYVNATYPYSFNEWHHVALVGDGSAGGLKLYFDGALAASGGTATSNYGSSSYPVNIGGGGIFDPTGNWFNGAMDDARIYNRALSGSEVQALYNQSSLVAYWKLDETSGTTASDVSGNNNSGALVNGPTWVGGKVGNALSFDGVNDYVNVSNPASFDVFSSGASSKLFTFAAWIKFNTVPTGTAWATLFSAHSSLYPAVFRYINGQFVLWIYSGGWRTPVTATFTPQAGRWYHLAYVKYSSTGWNIYINGVNYAVGTNTYTSSVPSYIYLGAYAPSSGSFNGVMDEVRVYNRALSATEVQAMFTNSGSGPQMELGSAKPAIPFVTKLMQCSPNPFAGQTAINFQLATPAQTTIKIYNINGQVVKILVNECLRPGYHSVKWDGKSDNGQKVAAGVYLYRMQAGDYSKTNKMTVLR